MFNLALYKSSIKNSWKTLVLLCSIISLYVVMVVSMYDPAMKAMLDDYMQLMPELMKMMGMVSASATLLGFMENYLYGFIVLIFPMIFTINLANKLIAKHVDKGSMAQLLASPVKRNTIAITQLAVLLTGIFLMITYITVLGIVAAQMYFPGDLEVSKYLLLNFGLLGLHLFIGGICYLCSCLFNETKNCLGVSTGIVIASFVFQMIANLGDKLENAKHLTFFTLFDSSQLIESNSSALFMVVVLYIGAIVLYIGAIEIFKKKDLHV